MYCYSVISQRLYSLSSIIFDAGIGNNILRTLPTHLILFGLWEGRRLNTVRISSICATYGAKETQSWEHLYHTHRGPILQIFLCNQAEAVLRRMLPIKKKQDSTSQETPKNTKSWKLLSVIPLVFLIKYKILLIISSSDIINTKWFNL